MVAATQSRWGIIRSGHGFRCPRRIATFLACALASVFVSRADVVFSSSFESCNGSGWNGALGSVSYSATGCQDGPCCGQQTISQGANQASVFWYKALDQNFSQIVLKASWKFPTGFTFGTDSGAAFKALILETSTGRNRMFVNFNTASDHAAHVVALVEGPNAKFLGYNQGGGPEPLLNADGQWHTVQVEWTRTVGVDAGHVRLWFDGNLHLDSPITTCNDEYGACPSFGEFKAGAYQNWTALQTQSFFLDNVSVSTTGGGAAPPNVSGVRRTDVVP